MQSLHPIRHFFSVGKGTGCKICTPYTHIFCEPFGSEVLSAIARQMNCPPEIKDYYVAMATLTGPLVMDVRKLGDLVKEQRTALEGREELASRMLPGEFVAPYMIVGIYKDREQASAGLEWVRAWRAGS